MLQSLANLIISYLAALFFFIFLQMKNKCVDFLLCNRCSCIILSHYINYSKASFRLTWRWELKVR